MMDHKFIKKIEKTKKATVTLACVDKKEVKAHREILVKYSRYFQKHLGTAQRRIQIPCTKKLPTMQNLTIIGHPVPE